MRITTRFRRGVSATVRAEIRSFVRWYEREAGTITTPVVIHVVDHPYLSVTERYEPHAKAADRTYGEIVVTPVADEPCIIWIAGAEDPDGPENHDIVLVVAHEIAHYEQWVENRPLTEQGANVRAASLYAKWRAA